MRTLLFCLLFLIVFGLKTTAGQTSNGNVLSIRISAEVSSAVKVITIQNIRFDDVRPSENIIKISPLRESNAGFMKAIGKPNSQVRISFPQQKTIYRTDGSGSLIFDYVVGVNNQSEQASADILQNEGKVFTLNENGELYIWVGGRVDISNATPGLYTGSFKLKIEYI